MRGGPGHRATCIDALYALANKIRNPLANHHGGHIGVSPDAVGHDRGIHDPQIANPVDAAELVDYGHGV